MEKFELPQKKTCRTFEKKALKAYKIIQVLVVCITPKIYNKKETNTKIHFQKFQPEKTKLPNVVRHSPHSFF